MEGAAQTLLSNAGQLLSEEYRLLRGVGGEVAELRDDLETMNALLIMQSEAEDGAVDHFVRAWMKQLRELAYDTEDCIDLYKLRIRFRPHDGVFAWLGRLLETLLPRRRLAVEIRALRARATTISERHARYGVDREALRRRSIAPLSAPPTRAMLNDDPDRHRHEVVGIEDQVDTLVERLKDRRGELMVFSVVGFGGLGKTTLAMEVCRRLEAHFQRQAIVSLSQEFQPSRDLNPLLSRVVEQVVTDRTDEGENIKQEEILRQTYGLEDDDPVRNLEKLLKDKRYLIVIDDVWTIRAWEAVQSKLPENNSGSRIIVTTRIETVATACSFSSVSGNYIHRMRPLEPQDSKKLFLSRAFGSVSAVYPEELRDVMDDILKKCGGLPLAIVSIASILAGYKSSGSKEKWETVCKSIGSQMESDPTLEGMNQIVRLGYDHLPHELKGCMMYLSVFPEDYVMDKYRLLCRWIAEGLVRERRGLTTMEVAESYLEELVSRNMIQLQDDFGYFWKAESCRVHDMLLEVMVCKSLESNFVSLLGERYAGMSYDRIRRLSIQGGDDNSRHQNVKEQRKKHGHLIEEMDVEHVRSLSMFRHKGQKLLDNLDKFPLLRVLDLECCEDLANHHMRYICRLYLLRFLSLKGTSVSEVPPQIEKLEHLQTLDLRDTRVRGLSGAVKRLYNLERLQISQTRVLMQSTQNHQNWDPKCMWRMPRGLKKMKALREVSFAFLGNDKKVAQDVGELEQLQELSVCVDTSSTEEEVLEEFARSLSKSCSLRRLIIAGVGFKKGELNFLHRLHAPPRLLRYLMIAGGVEGLPAWIGSLANLVHFNMSWGQLVGDQLFDVLCKLRSLKTVGIQNACFVGGELVARTRHRFPELTDLRVACRYETLNAIRFEIGSMSRLETLLFEFHDKEKKIAGIEHLTNIREVHLLGNKNNPSLGHALEQLKDENNRRRLQSSSQFQIVVKYHD